MGRESFQCRACRGLRMRAPALAAVKAAIFAANRPAPQDWARRATGVLTELAKRAPARPFLEPVPKSLKDYHALIKQVRHLRRGAESVGVLVGFGSS